MKGMVSSSSSSPTFICCDACGEPPRREHAKLLSCSRCKQVWYHDRICQRQHYKQHKPHCQELQRERERELQRELALKSDASDATVSPTLTSTSTVSPTSAPTPTLTLTASFCGIQVASSPSLGRIGIATQDFETGSVVLLESPAIVFDDLNGYFGLWNAYLDAPISIQTDIVSTMQSSSSTTPSLPTKRAMIDSELQRYYDSHAPARNKLLSKRLATTLVGIVSINGHSFFPKAKARSKANNENGNDKINGKERLNSGNSHSNSHYHAADMGPQPKTALYLIGSKLQHSCAPNLTMETNTTTNNTSTSSNNNNTSNSNKNNKSNIIMGGAEGMLEYTAEMNIPKKGCLSISYQNCIYEENRQQRRDALLENMEFWCECPRCLGLDECSPLNCPECFITTTNNNNTDETNKNEKFDGNGTLFQYGSDESWICLACNWKAPKTTHTTNSSASSLSTTTPTTTTSNSNSVSTMISSQMRTHEKFSQKLDDVKRRLESTGFDPRTMVQECCLVQNLMVSAAKISPLHWLYPKVWHSIRVVATSQARLLLLMNKNNNNNNKAKNEKTKKNGKKNKGKNKKNGNKNGESTTTNNNNRIMMLDPKVLAMIRLSANCQLQHFLWAKRNVAIVHGWVKLEEIYPLLRPPDMILFETSVATKEQMENLLDSILLGAGEQNISNTSTSCSTTTTQVAHLIFHAGLDLLLAGHNTRVAKLFDAFGGLFARWKGLDEDNRNKIRVLVESKGEINEFPNHLLV